MPIKSYIAYPSEGKRQELIEALKEFEECEVIPSENHKIIIVVTETDSKEEEKVMEAKLKEVNSLMMLSMVAGFDTN
ncbi:chaperone NapD [Aureivirga sp. CE67]|uniref:chaperone NapD n=1 Tax=Aureivirga sp. CE67 TaxID=1788983 RepID=UPI0018C9518B|nr:chaperone NapD [Aureivirga sp. CE67]